MPDGCYPLFRTGFVSTRFFLFLRRTYTAASAEQRFQKNSPQSSLIWSKEPLSLISEQSWFADFPVSFREVPGTVSSQTDLYFFCSCLRLLRSFSRTSEYRRYPLFRNNLESDVFPAAAYLQSGSYGFCSAERRIYS